MIITQHTEHAFSQPEKRVFDILVGKMRVKSNVDVYKLTGGRGISMNLYIPLMIKN